MNKALKLLTLAFAAHRRGEVEIAKNIFSLAAAEDSEVIDDTAMPKPDPEVLKAKIAKALKDEDLDGAQAAMDELKTLGKEPAAAADAPVVDEKEPAAADAEDGDGDGDDDDLDLGAEQVASLVKIAKKIKAAGHVDLAEKITAALAK